MSNYMTKFMDLFRKKEHKKANTQPEKTPYEMNVSKDKSKDCEYFTSLCQDCPIHKKGEEFIVKYDGKELEIGVEGGKWSKRSKRFWPGNKWKTIYLEQDRINDESRDLVEILEGTLNCEVSKHALAEALTEKLEKWEEKTVYVTPAGCAPSCTFELKSEDGEESGKLLGKCQIGYKITDKDNGKTLTERVLYGAKEVFEKVEGVLRRQVDKDEEGYLRASWKPVSEKLGKLKVYFSGFKNEEDPSIAEMQINNEEADFRHMEYEQRNKKNQKEQIKNEEIDRRGNTPAKRRLFDFFKTQDPAEYEVRPIVPEEQEDSEDNTPLSEYTPKPQEQN